MASVVGWWWHLLGVVIPSFLAGLVPGTKRKLEAQNEADVGPNLSIQIQSLKEQLLEKTEELNDIEYLNRMLMTKQLLCNNELQEARKAAMSVLENILTDRSTLRIKLLGEVDIRPFRKMFIGEHCGVDQEDRSAILCSKWQEAVRNPQWQPFKKIFINGKLEEVIDDNDEELKRLRSECGDEAYEAVANALMELNEYNPSGRYIVPEIWNPFKGRKASMKEIIEYLPCCWMVDAMNLRERTGGWIVE